MRILAGNSVPYPHAAFDDAVITDSDQPSDDLAGVRRLDSLDLTTSGTAFCCHSGNRLGERIG